MLPVISAARGPPEALSNADEYLNWDTAWRKLARPKTASAVKANTPAVDTAGRLASVGRRVT